MSDVARPSNTRVAALRHLHDKLKSGDYDGTDVMAAWIAVEDLACLLEKQSEPPPAGQEPRSFAPWRVPDPPRTDAVEALRPFVELFEKSNERYRKRGGDPDQFADSHPFREITARELPLGVWRRAQAAMRAPSPSAVRRCNHGAISPKGTMFYHGFVSNQFNQWRCDVCRGVYEGNLTEPMNPGSQSLTLTAPPPCPSHAAEHRMRDTLPCPWCAIDELKRNRDSVIVDALTDALRCLEAQATPAFKLADGTVYAMAGSPIHKVREALKLCSAPTKPDEQS